MNNLVVKKKKVVTFSNFNQVFIIPNRDQLKILQYDYFNINTGKKDPFDINNGKYGRFNVTKLI